MINLTFVAGEAVKPSSSLFSQPVFIAAMLTFSGVLITVIVGTVVNFQLAKRRNEFEKELAIQRFENEKSLAEQKLFDDKLARQQSRDRDLELRRIDFQRQNILGLQEAVHALINKLQQACSGAKEKMEGDGQLKWKAAIDSTELLNDVPKLFTTVALCEVRSVHANIRQQVAEIRGLSDKIMLSESKNQALKDITVLKSLFAPFLFSTGEVVRELDGNGGL
jgi:hypothetical protein